MRKGLRLSIFLILFFVAAPVFPALGGPNLLANPGAVTGDATGWTVSANGGSGWTFTDVFATSYNWCRKYQIVDLLGKGYTAAQLDAQPEITCSDWILQRFDADGTYQLIFKLLGADGNPLNPIVTYDTGAIDVARGTDWFQVSHTFTNYGAGVRYVYFEHGGKDRMYWAGQYGPYFDDASVTVEIPSPPVPDSHNLTVVTSGTGSGWVSSAPSGIDCPSDCDATYQEGTQVVLIAHAGDGSAFSGWSEDGCSGTGDCTVTMDASKTVTAAFGREKTLTLKLRGEGAGTVKGSPGDIECNSDCEAQFAEGTAVKLWAAPEYGSVFAGWKGAGCKGTQKCYLAMNVSQEVKAFFEKDPNMALLTISPPQPTARIVSDPESIDCIPDCARYFAHMSTVKLQAMPEPNWGLQQWDIDPALASSYSGNCGCKVLMDRDRTVTPIIAMDSDNDGVVDVFENQGPNSGDGNGDGIPDAQQANVATLPGMHGNRVTLTAPANMIFSKVCATGNPSPKDCPLPDGRFLCGYFSFELHGVPTGGPVSVELTLHAAGSPMAGYYGYGSTPNMPTPHWYEFSYDGSTGAEFPSGKVVTLHFVDGLRGDEDLTANGIVKTFGGPVIQ